VKTVAPKLQETAQGKVIVLAEAFDKSWRKVALALEQASVSVEDRDRANGVFFVRAGDVVQEKGLLDKLAFWRGSESKKAARYQVLVRAKGDACEVSASGDGASTPDTQHLIEKLFQSLGK
jgi:outer membrane protein assembly factor BamC